MGDIIDSKDKFKAKHNEGETLFMGCDCTDEFHPLIPVVRLMDENPIIDCLVCENCEYEYPVINGYVHEPVMNEGA